MNKKEKEIQIALGSLTYYTLVISVRYKAMAILRGFIITPAISANNAKEICNKFLKIPRKRRQIFDIIKRNCFWRNHKYFAIEYNSSITFTDAYVKPSTVINIDTEPLNPDYIVM